MVSQSSIEEVERFQEGLSLLHNFRFKEASDFYHEKLNQQRTLWNLLHYGEILFYRAILTEGYLIK